MHRRQRGHARLHDRSGGTNGLSNRITLPTAVDTSKSFIVVTSAGRQRHRGRARASTRCVPSSRHTGTSVTGVQFARARDRHTANHQLLITYEVVTLSDGSTVQSRDDATHWHRGTATATLTTVVDTTRTVRVLFRLGR